MTSEFIRKAQRAVHYAIACKNDGIVERTAAINPIGAKRLDNRAQNKKFVRGQQVPKKCLAAPIHFYVLLTDQGCGKST